MCLIEEILRDHKNTIDLLKWTIILLLGIYTARRIKLTSQKNKFDYFSNLNDQFLNQETIKKRNEVCDFWFENKITKTRTWREGGASCDRIGRETNPRSLIELINKQLCLEIKDDVDEYFIARNSDIIAKTEDILNLYEHLGKLVEGGIIPKSDLKIFFYTLMGDTFIACLPYILYRRRNKPKYAHKMQKLLVALKEYSGDPRHV